MAWNSYSVSGQWRYQVGVSSDVSFDHDF